MEIFFIHFFSERKDVLFVYSILSKTISFRILQKCYLSTILSMEKKFFSCILILRKWFFFEVCGNISFPFSTQSKRNRFRLYRCSENISFTTSTKRDCFYVSAVRKEVLFVHPIKKRFIVENLERKDVISFSKLPKRLPFRVSRKRK